MRRVIILALLFLVCHVALTAEKQTIRIGVLAYRGVEQTRLLWTPTANYLNDAISKYQFKIIPLNYVKLKKALQYGEIEYVLTNTGHYVELEADFGVTRIATLINKHGKHNLTQFGAIIFTRTTHPVIKSIKDLHNKRFVAVKPYAFGGFRMGWAELLDNGIDPFTDFKNIEFSGFPVDKLVYSVLKGEYDAGTIRTGVLERLHKSGKIDINDFRILAAKKIKGFPFSLSTKLYPEWPFSKTATAPKDLTKSLTIALLRLSADSESARAANIRGWTVPLDYQHVHELYKRLKVGPYKNHGKVSLQDILNHYWHIVLFTFVIILLLTIIIVYILKLDKKVRKSEYSLAKAQEIAHIGNWEWSISKNEMKWSEEIYHIFGIDDHSKHTGIEDYLNRVHPDDKEFVKISLNDALYHKRPFNIDHRIISVDGITRVVHQQAETSYNETGKADGMSGIVQDITERKSAEDRLRESEQELASILNNMQDTFFRISYNGRVTSVSPSIAQLLGYEMDEVLEARFVKFVVKGQNRKGFMQQLKDNYGRVDNFEMKLLHKSGTVLITAISAHYIYDKSGDLEGIEGIARNISELIHTRDDLTKEKERIQTTLESIGDGVITTDISGVVEYMNAIAEKLTGWKLQDAKGLRLLDVFNVKASTVGDSVEDALKTVLDEDSSTPKVVHDAVLKDQDKNKYFVEVTFAQIKDHDAHRIGCVIIFHDVTEVHELAKRMAYHAKHDALTGLMNRRELESRVELILKQSPSIKEHALLYIDLDNFKKVNDSCGHIAGDELLKQIADQFKSKIRDMDTLARIGGDEFCLLLQNCPVNQAKNIGDSLVEVTRHFRFAWGEDVFQIGLNIGLVVFKNSGTTVSDIMNDADIACYKSKEGGSNIIYVHEDQEEVVQKRNGEQQWVNRLKKAVDENRFVIYYQELVPVNKTECKEKHYELLVRMKDEQGNIILPMAFIPAAERYKMISTIDRWIFDHTIELISNLHSESNSSICTINLSGQSIASHEFTEYVTSQIEKHPEIRNHLCFEVSETSAVSNYAETSNFIHKLHALGCRFTLDDFGNGVSSFSYLKSLPVDCVKIDGALVRNIVDHPVEYAIVQSINQIAHAMGKKTVAKCVENEKIEDRLKDIGVDYAQGYGLKKPEPFTSKIIVSKSA